MSKPSAFGNIIFFIDSFLKFPVMKTKSLQYITKIHQDYSSSPSSVSNVLDSSGLLRFSILMHDSGHDLSLFQLCKEVIFVPHVLLLTFEK